MHQADVEATCPLEVVVPVTSACHALLVAKVSDDLGRDVVHHFSRDAEILPHAHGSCGIDEPTHLVMLAVLDRAMAAEGLVSFVLLEKEESSVDEASVLLHCSHMPFQLSFTRSPRLACSVSFVHIGGNEARHRPVFEDVKVCDHAYAGAVNQH